MKNKVRRNLPKILEVYRSIASYIYHHNEAPSFAELVRRGCGGSTSVISYYFDELVELKMAVRTKSGSIYLLPLEEADLSIRKLIKGGTR